MPERVKASQSLSVDEKRQFEAAIARFEDAWHDRGEPEIASFLPTEGPVRAALLEELMQIDMEFRRSRGEQPARAGYVRQFPELEGSKVGSASHTSGSHVDAAGELQQRTITMSQESTDASIASDGKAQEPSIPERFGRYKILKALGQGAMGAVYLAQDTQLDRRVALKIPKFSGAQQAELLERFYREARSAAMLRHPNICPVFDVGEIDGQHYITMAFIEGRLLKEFTRGKKPQPERKVAAVIRKLAEGLAEAHALGVIHRDLKPANIMIDARGEPVVMDFGLARRTSADEVHVTHSGAIIGTPAYMSPEQVAGDQRQIGPTADIYSLGVIFYELLSGQLPFQGGLLSILQQIAVNAPVPPSQLRPGVDPRLEAICLKMMSKPIEDRPQSMKDVVQTLTDYLKLPAKPTAGGTESPPEPAQTLSALIAGAQVETAQPILKTPAKSAAPVAAEASHFDGAAWRVRNLTPRTKLAVFGSLAACVLAAVTLVMRLGEVDVKIVINDPSLAVRFDKQAVTFEGSGSAIRLRPGERKFIVERDGLEAETDSFTVKKDGKNVLEVSIVDGKVTVQKEVQPRPGPQVATAGKRAGINTETNSPPGWQGWPADAPPPAIAPFDPAQAKKHQEAWATYLKVPVEYTNSIGMKFRLVPPGEFQMGSTPAEIEAAVKLVSSDKAWQEQIRSESPQHEVILTQPIYLGIHEVTQHEYLTVTGRNPSSFCASGHPEWIRREVEGLDTANFPAENMEWIGSSTFCQKLSEREGFSSFNEGEGNMLISSQGAGYRLPTEAEWEFACRAGTIGKYWPGEDSAKLIATDWFNENARNRTHPVGELAANAFGFHDMHGNVSEWCHDTWDVAYFERFRTEAAVNPWGPDPPGAVHATRGGNWFIPQVSCRSAVRWAPFGWSFHTGMRPVLALDSVRKALHP